MMTQEDWEKYLLDSKSTLTYNFNINAVKYAMESKWKWLCTEMNSTYESLRHYQPSVWQKYNKMTSDERLKYCIETDHMVACEMLQYLALKRFYEFLTKEKTS